MSPEHYAFLTALLRRECGLVLDAEKTYLAEARLSAVARQFGRKDIDDLIANVMSNATRQSVEAIIDAMATNETYFFRDRQPFVHFAKETLPRLIEARKFEKRLKIWSAAASTGQEPYSLAMILSAFATELADWRVDLLATDISNQALARAESGIYSQFEVQRGLPIKQLLKHFTKTGDRWRIKPALRGAVTFRRANLLKDISEIGSVDIIFCRNVLIYFDQERRAAVLKELAKTLPPDGALYLGGAESITGASDLLSPVDGVHGYYRPSPALSQKPEALAG